MDKKTLSVVIITLNEEKVIRRCLDSIKDIVSEIIVVIDDRTTDKTAEIAKEYGAKVYFRKFDDYADQKNFALEKAAGKWVFSIDADEVVPKELCEEILEAIKNEDINGYLIPRRNFLLGAEIKHTRWSPDKHIWLWRKGKGKWVGKVHEEVEVEGKVGELGNAKIHYQYKNVTEFMDMVNRYTEHEAEKIVDKGRKFSFLTMCWDAKLTLFRRYIYKRGFLDGWRGFILSYLMSVYRLATWVKVWEKG